MADFHSFFLAISGALFGFGPAPKPVAYERAVATLYVDGAGRPLKLPIRFVLEGDEAERLAAYFPTVGEQRGSGKPTAWKHAAEVWLVRNDGTDAWVRVGFGYGTWNEGTGDRNARPGLWDFLRRRAL